MHISTVVFFLFCLLAILSVPQFFPFSFCFLSTCIADVVQDYHRGKRRACHDSRGMFYELRPPLKAGIHVEYGASRRYMDSGMYHIRCSGVTCLFEATRIDWCVEDRSSELSDRDVFVLFFWGTYHTFGFALFFLLLFLLFFVSPHILKHCLSFGTYLRKNRCADILM